MKKAALIVLTVLLLMTVSCDNKLMENLMLTKTVTLKVTKNGDYYEAIYTGEASSEADIFDCIELAVPDEYKNKGLNIYLLKDCLGDSQIKAKKIVIPKEITTLKYKCISDENVTEIDIYSDCDSFDDYSYSYGSFEGCTKLTKVLFNDVKIDESDLIGDQS